METAIAAAQREGLVARARRGDQRAWRELFERDREEVYRLAYRILLDREEALDTVQETFCKAFENVGRLSDDDAWRPWLRTIGVRTALTQVRRGGRLARWLGWRVEEQQLAVTPRQGETPLTYAEHSEVARALEGVLRRLSPRQRAVASLHFEMGLSGPEIAALLGVRLGTVRAHLFRARKRLQRGLARFVPPGDGR